MSRKSAVWWQSELLVVFLLLAYQYVVFVSFVLFEYVCSTRWRKSPQQWCNHNRILLLSSNKPKPKSIKRTRNAVFSERDDDESTGQENESPSIPFESRSRRILGRSSIRLQASCGGSRGKLFDWSKKTFRTYFKNQHRKSTSTPERSYLYYPHQSAAISRAINLVDLFQSERWQDSPSIDSLTYPINEKSFPSPSLDWNQNPRILLSPVERTVVSVSSSNLCEIIG